MSKASEGDPKLSDILIMGFMTLVIIMVFMGGVVWLFGPSKPPGNEPVERLTEHESRIRVHGGWVVTTFRGCCFVPDPQHEWKLSEVKK